MQFTRVTEITSIFFCPLPDVNILDFHVMWWSIHESISLLTAVFSITAWKSKCANVTSLKNNNIWTKTVIFQPEERLIKTLHFQPRLSKIHLLSCIYCVCLVYTYKTIYCISPLPLFCYSIITRYLNVDSPLNICILLPFKWKQNIYIQLPFQMIQGSHNQSKSGKKETLSRVGGNQGKCRNWYFPK